MAGLTFERLREQNIARVVRWHGEDDWSLADWSNAMCGEAGEAANVVKKMRRLETGIQGTTRNRTELLLALGYEVADTVIYADLVLHKVDMDLSQMIVAKFNIVSNSYGFPEMLP